VTETNVNKTHVISSTSQTLYCIYV